MSRTLRTTLAAAALALLAAPAAALADPADPPCRLHWEKPVVWTDENGIPRYVEVSRPYWVC